MSPPSGPEPKLVWPSQSALEPQWPAPAAGPLDDVTDDRPQEVEDDFGDVAAMVRPYQWTRGRTKASIHLELETLVSTSESGQDEQRLTQLEHRAIASLCRHPHAVAEVAAKLSVPLGVAKVLISDMTEQGLITVHRTVADDDDTAAHLMLMERVLSGLRRL